MGKSISVDEELHKEYGELATALHMPWEDLFKEALELALPEIKKRYTGCPKCGQVPHKDALYCGTCGTAIRAKAKTK